MKIITAALNGMRAWPSSAFMPAGARPACSSFPLFEQLAEHYAQVNPKIKFGKVNIDQSPILTLRYHVYGLPSTLIFRNGAIIKRIAGVKSLAEMKSIVDGVSS